VNIQVDFKPSQLGEVGKSFTSDDFIYLAFDKAVSSPKYISPIESVKEIMDSDGMPAWKISFENTFSYNDTVVFELFFAVLEGNDTSIKYATICPWCASLQARKNASQITTFSKAQTTVITG
jgi:hypothetical protein